MKTHEKTVLRFKVPKKVEQAVVRQVREKLYSDFGNEVRKILIAGCSSAAVDRRIRSEWLKRRGGRHKTTWADFHLPLASRSERHALMMLLSMTAAHHTVRLSMDRPFEVSDLVAAILETYLDGNIDPGKPAKPMKRRKLVETAQPPKESMWRMKQGGKLQRVHEKRRKRSRPKKPKQPIYPHPDHPDVQATPCDWQPGKRGRPPLGVKRNSDGSWKLPESYRLIAGKWHAPMPTKKGYRKSTRRAASIPTTREIFAKEESAVKQADAADAREQTTPGAPANSDHQEGETPADENLSPPASGELSAPILQDQEPIVDEAGGKGIVSENEQTGDNVTEGR